MFNLLTLSMTLKLKRYFGEDFGFCQRWSDMGGKIHVYLKNYITTLANILIVVDFGTTYIKVVSLSKVLTIVKNQIKCDISGLVCLPYKLNLDKIMALTDTTASKNL
ncbi:MAG: hypothetical protein CM15mV127_320 [Caudoviricetes sp.]|nr:MAG: hypothetical protein CM15mV127_320 [Caudoviricetes sp.]